jgi:hypothetical protein
MEILLIHVLPDEVCEGDKLHQPEHANKRHVFTGADRLEADEGDLKAIQERHYALVIDEVIYFHDQEDSTCHGSRGSNHLPAWKAAGQGQRTCSMQRIDERSSDP